MELLGFIVILCLKFLKNCKTVFHSSCTIFHSHQRCMRVPVPPHPCQHLFSVCCNHPTGCEMLSHMILISTPWWRRILLIISCGCRHLYTSFSVMYIQVLYSFFLKWVDCLFVTTLQNFLTYPGYLVFIRYINYWYFLPFCRFLFHFLDNVFWYTKVFNFDHVDLTKFLVVVVVALAFIVICQTQGYEEICSPVTVVRITWFSGFGRSSNCCEDTVLIW